MRGCERVRKINRLRWKTEKEIKSVALALKKAKADSLKDTLRIVRLKMFLSLNACFSLLVFPAAKLVLFLFSQN